MKSYISYNLFRNRTKFNPLSLFFSNKDITYEEFKLYFNNKDIESPNIEYYNRVKDKFIEVSGNKLETNTVIEEEKKEESISIDKKVIAKQNKPRKINRKKKAVKDENN